MPEISRFFGIIIRMYVELGAPHHHPHLHAYYQNVVGIYRIDQIEMIEGSLAQKEQRLVEAPFAARRRSGLFYIKMNYWKIGNGCSLVNCLSRLRRSNRKKV